MKKNMGIIDRTLRLLIAAILIALVALEIVEGVVAYGLLALAAIFIVTSTVAFCPLYVPFSISSLELDKKFGFGKSHNDSQKTSTEGQEETTEDK